MLERLILTNAMISLINNAHQSIGYTISRTRKVYTPKFLRLWSLKTWRENFLLLAWKVKNSRATTKKFRCHFWEKHRPQF
nr:DUF1661 domain-containing protein [Porphyromonas gingivalis]